VGITAFLSTSLDPFELYFSAAFAKDRQVLCYISVKQLIGHSVNYIILEALPLNQPEYYETLEANFAYCITYVAATLIFDVRFA
jgi:hypothetical protein